MVKEIKTDDTTTPDTGSTHPNIQNDNMDRQKNGSTPSWMIMLISCFGGIIAVCAVVLAVFMKKKKQENK